MAVVNYTGGQIARPKKATLTLAVADPAATITLTGGNSQVCVITPSSATLATAATDIVNAVSAAGGVFSELIVSSSGAVVTFEGPADGKTFTLSKADAGTNSTTLTTTQTPKSPYDVTDVLNWSTGALPVDTVDSIDLENGSADMRYNLTGLAAIELAAPGFVRRETYTGRIGLDPINPLGFPEYLATELSLESATYRIEATQNDQANQFRILNTGVAAVTFVVQGEGAGTQVGSECVYIRGLPASSIVTVVGGSLSISPLSGQACTVLTLTATDSTISVGPSATLSGTVSLTNCSAMVKSSWTTSLTMDGGDVEITGSAAGVIVNEAGNMNWRSTGNPGASPVLGSGAILDLSQAPAALTISGTIQMYAGSTLNDPAGRGGNWAVKTVHCTLQEVTIVTRNDSTYTKS